METKGFFQFESIINVLVSSFIWIPMLWVHGHYKYVYSYSAGIDLDVRICRLQIKFAQQLALYRQNNIDFHVLKHII